jgi:hypothetical protein
LHYQNWACIWQELKTSFLLKLSFASDKSQGQVQLWQRSCGPRALHIVKIIIKKSYPLQLVYLVLSNIF